APSLRRARWKGEADKFQVPLRQTPPESTAHSSSFLESGLHPQLRLSECADGGSETTVERVEKKETAEPEKSCPTRSTHAPMRRPGWAARAAHRNALRWSLRPLPVVPK